VYFGIAYCSCDGPEEGQMIFCDNSTCSVKWFHYDCVDITEAPEGSWFCPQCTAEVKDSLLSRVQTVPASLESKLSLLFP
jgi:PHP family Zn ribbon phosphoesterase